MLRGLFIFIFLLFVWGMPSPLAANTSRQGTALDGMAGFKKTSGEIAAEMASTQAEIDKLEGEKDPDKRKANQPKIDQLKEKLGRLRAEKMLADNLAAQAQASAAHASKGDEATPQVAKAEEPKKNDEKKNEPKKEEGIAKIEMPKSIDAQVTQDAAVKTEKPVAAAAGPSTGKADIRDEIEERRFNDQMTQIAEGNKTAVNALLARQTVDLKKADMTLKNAPPVTIAQKLQNGAPAPRAHPAPLPVRAVETGYAFKARER